MVGLLLPSDLKKEPDQLLPLYDKNDDIDVIFGKKQTLPKKNKLNGESAKSDWFNQREHSLVLLHEKGEDLSAWTHNNVWSQQDFDICTWGDHPTLTAKQGGPECDFLFSANANSVQRQLQLKIAELKGRKANGDEGLWMYLDSGASRSVISETSPLSETSGSCNVGNGATLNTYKKA